MRIGLAVYGTVFTMGLHSESNRPTISVQQLMDQALAAHLQGVEIPVSLLKDADISAVAQAARARGLFITLATGGYTAGPLIEAIHLAAQLKAETVRTVVGGAKIGGDRSPLTGRWPAFLQDVLTNLKEATAIADKVGVNLAVENHQDLASEELLWLCESIGSTRFGINLDAGNPLATAEEPLDYFRRVAPYLKNVHLKDYYIYLSEEGYRLVRCPLGQGVIDFPALFKILATSCPNVTMSIELGALEARHIRVLAADYWPDYPPRSAAQLANVLRFVQANAKPVGDWRTPFERKEPVEDIIAYEQQQLAASLAYLSYVQALNAPM
ncbi:MAG TPA: sugar phosphate isomerase/epimerase family protein [Ktedonobacteraceae bacterium]|jgi:sugar phosphate isomerase/epimerase|nr:sugar phosphate isomerase/epimerase family protein [Ktedonobacteraceae bacterium]